MLNFYLYSITAISLAAFYAAAIVAVNGVLRLLFGADLGQAGQTTAAQMVAGALGYLVIALPLWWLHWRWLRLEFAHADGPAVSWHRFYLFTIVCLNAMAILLLGSSGISGVLRVALGAVGPNDRDLTQAGVFLFATALSAFLWLHHWNQFKGGRGRLLAKEAGELEISPVP